MLNRNKILLLAGIALAVVVSVSLPWGGTDDDTSDVVPAGSGAVHPDAGQAPVVREDAGENVDPAAESTVTPEEFGREFRRLYYEEGGQEERMRYLQWRAEQRRGTVNEHHVRGRIEAYNKLGLPTGPVDSSAFEMLPYGGDMHAGNAFNHHGAEYLDWIRRGGNSEAIEAVAERMDERPLNYPPEMFLYRYSGGAVGREVPEELAAAVNQYRNYVVQQDSLLYQETRNMLGTLKQTAKSLGMDVDMHVEERVFREYCEEWASLWEDRRQLELGYPVEIRALLVAHGYQVVE